MFKKISLVAAGASAAEYGGSDKAITLCAKEATLTAYTASLHCSNGMITLTGGAAIADNDLTDGYKATISLGFLEELSTNTVSLAYGVCVIPVAKTGADDTAYQKDPSGVCIGIATASASTAALGGTYGALNNQPNLIGRFFGTTDHAKLVTAGSADSAFTVRKNDAESGDTGAAAQTGAALLPVCVTTQAAVKTWGPEAVTVPATDFYSDGAATVFVNASDLGITAATTVISATFTMPIEADDYPTMPRLSPADLDGWMPYAFNVGTAASFGKPVALTAITKDTIITNFATTVAAGVAIIGATALSF